MLVETDVTDPASIAATIEDVEDAFGPIGVLVHLVGAWKGGEPIHELSLDTWDRMLELNLRSTLLCCRAVLPWMRDRGWGASRIGLEPHRTEEPLGPGRLCRRQSWGSDSCRDHRRREPRFLRHGQRHRSIYPRYCSQSRSHAPV